MGISMTKLSKSQKRKYVFVFKIELLPISKIYNRSTTFLTYRRKLVVRLECFRTKSCHMRGGTKTYSLCTAAKTNIYFTAGS